MISLSVKLNRDLERLYDRRRQDAYQRRDDRLRALYDAYPELRKLDIDIRRLGFERLQADCRAFEEGTARQSEPADSSPPVSDDDREKSISSTSDSLKRNVSQRSESGMTAARRKTEQAFQDALARRDAFLLEYGIDDRYQEPDYICSVCEDTGRVGNRWCACRNLAVQSFMPRYFPDPMNDDALFSNFNLNLFDSHVKSDKKKIGVSPREIMAGYVKMATTYVSNFDRLKDRNLFFSGAPGTGKTFLMQCIGHRLMEEGKAVIYVSSPTLFDMMARYKRQQLSFRADPEQLEEATMLYEALLSWDLLLIDDLGTEPLTQESFAQLLTVLDTRQNKRLSTIIASNLTVRDLSKKYDQRIASRIAGDYLTCNFPSGDIRLRKKRLIEEEESFDSADGLNASPEDLP
ncbi:MAG: ATP-binding protein [Clostridiaceae bacterium]|jgi:DNA replication protein DnaC|nr:ATP-binding protein [Clostridiaceae bacterium]